MFLNAAWTCGGILRPRRPGQRGRFGLRRLERCAGRQPGEHAVGVVAAARLQLLLAEGQRHEDVGGLAVEQWADLREHRALGHHADDHERPAIEQHATSDHGGIGGEAASPQRVAQDRGVGAGSGVVGRKRAAKARLHAQDVEERRRDDGDVDALALALTGQLDAAVAVGGDGAERTLSGDEVLEIERREGDACEADAGRRLVDGDDPAIVGERQRRQQHRADQAEDRRAGADGERQREERRGREPGMTGEPPQPVAAVLPRLREDRADASAARLVEQWAGDTPGRLRRLRPFGVDQLASEHRPVGDDAVRRLLGSGVIGAGGPRLVVGLLHLLRQLLDDLGLAIGWRPSGGRCARTKAMKGDGAIGQSSCGTSAIR